MNKTALIAFFDESEKIADAAVGMEMLGAPGGLIEGYRKGGWKGVGTTAAGIAGGLGAGLLGRHLMQKHLTGGAWGAQHPILKTILDTAPIAMGGAVGGALGEHYGMHRPKVAGVTDVLSRAVLNTPQMVHEKRKLDVVPERYRRIMAAIENNIPVGQIHLP